MKNRSLATVLAILILISLTACASGGSTSAPMMSDTDSGAGASNSSKAEESSYSSEPQEPGGDVYSYTGESGAGAAESSVPLKAALSGAKIIYSASAKIETQDFDATIEGVYDMLERYGGFLESSSVTGRDYYSRGSVVRSADFTLRIPSEYFTEMTASLSDLGNVPYCNTFAENVTSQYVDKESRLSSYRVQEERLLDLLGKAETLEEMLILEERLAEVRYNIERFTTDLRNWDSLINYSTIDLTIQEVVEFTEEPVIQKGYWEQVGDGFSSTLSSVGGFFKDLFRVFVTALPILVILAIVAVVALLIVRRYMRRGK